MPMDYTNVAKVAICSKCIYCDYTTSKQSNFDKHILTAKHKKMKMDYKWITKM